MVKKRWHVPKGFESDNCEGQLALTCMQKNDEQLNIVLIFILVQS